MFGRSFVQSRNELELAAPPVPLSRKILPQGKSLRIIFRHQNAPEIRMTGKRDPHHVVHFALQKLGPFPDASHRGDRRVFLREANLEAQAPSMRQAMKVVHDLEPLTVLRVVDRTDIRQMVEERLWRVVEEFRYLDDGFSRHADGYLGPRSIGLDGLYRLRKSRHQGFDQRLHRYFTNTFSR